MPQVLDFLFPKTAFGFFFFFFLHRVAISPEVPKQSSHAPCVVPTCYYILICYQKKPKQICEGNYGIPHS
jgi:hypothetical protein